MVKPDTLTTVCLSLGSNLGDRKSNIDRAVALLEIHCGNLIAHSSFYETAAWGKSDQPSFYNIAVCLSTALKPEALLAQLLSIEQQTGRVRAEKWGPRLIDIDLIFYGDEIINTSGLTVPHPELQNRKFVLCPLTEIAADHMHPVLKKTVDQLLAALNDPLEVVRI